MPKYPTCLFCLPFYLMAGFGVTFPLLPADAFAIFGNAENLTPSLAVTLGFVGIPLGVGIALHVFFYRRSPERFDVKSFRQMLLVFACFYTGMCGLSLLLIRGLGWQPREVWQWAQRIKHFGDFYLVPCLLMLIVGCVGLLFLMIRYSRSQRMARCLQEGDFQKAIRLGEQCPPEKRTFALLFNLASAYGASGQVREVVHILDDMERKTASDFGVTDELFEQAKDSLRRGISEANLPDPGA